MERAGNLRENREPLINTTDFAYALIWSINLRQSLEYAEYALPKSCTLHVGPAEW